MIEIHIYFSITNMVNKYMNKKKELRIMIHFFKYEFFNLKYFFTKFNDLTIILNEALSQHKFI